MNVGGMQRAPLMRDFDEFRRQSLLFEPVFGAVEVFLAADFEAERARFGSAFFRMTE